MTTGLTGEHDLSKNTNSVFRILNNVDIERSEVYNIYVNVGGFSMVGKDVNVLLNITQYHRLYGITALRLPGKREGYFSLNGYDENGVQTAIARIEAVNGIWKCISNWRFVLIASDGSSMDETEITGNQVIRLKDNLLNAIVEFYAENAGAGSARYDKYLLPQEGTFFVGREGACFAYSHDAVVLKHARLYSRGEDWFIEDLNSAVGTFVNNVAIKKEKKLQVGDVIRIFQLRIVFMGNLIAVNQPAGFTLLREAFQPFQPARPEGSFDPAMHAVQLTPRFERAPRIRDDYEPVSIDVAAPPAAVNSERAPAVLTMGTSLTMGVTSMITASMSLQNAVNSGNGIGSAIPSLAMSVSMLCGSMVFPILNRRYEEKRFQREEARRCERYGAYLDDLRRKISRALKEQKEALLEKYASASECCSWAEQRGLRLFNRTPSDSDFLSLRLGLGQRELDGNIKFPHTEFSLNDNNLEVLLRQLQEEPRTMDQAPIVLSLMQHRVLGLVGERTRLIRYTFDLLMQICAAHSAEEVKLVLIASEDEASEWEYVRWFPHVWNNKHDFRLIAANVGDAQSLSAYLETVLMQQSDQMRSSTEQAHYVIVSTDPQLTSRVTVVQRLLKSIQQLSVSVIALNERLAQLPVECSAIVEVNDDSIQIYDKQIQSYKLTTAMREMNMYDAARKYSTMLGNLCQGASNESFTLPNSIDFLEFFKCSNFDQLRILDKWYESNPIKTLAAPMGVDQFGDEFCLDIHQDAHGPHGLVAGMTGSGKSEWIISYILSMAIHYSPLEVGFILIDYKGGGMSDTFKNLPHTVGIIDNLGGRKGIHRSMLCIESELARRQELFKCVSEEQKVSNLDIHKYQKMYREGRVQEPLQHLILISDEFAELKDQEPDFIDKLVSAARIGRSLGVHLILATQKPAGVVNDQITSNSRFRVCLKVQDRDDSVQMIRRPDAALLTRTGRFYFQVGFDEIFNLGQAAWCGAPYVPAPRFSEKVDSFVEMINDQGKEFIGCEAMNVNARAAANAPKQVDAIVEHIAKLAQKVNLTPRRLWHPMLSDDLTMDQLHECCDDVSRDNLVATIGMIDDPAQQAVYPLELRFAEMGNAIVYGTAGSGNDLFAHAVVDSLCRKYSAQDVNIYIVDMDSESATMFARMPQVGDVVIGGETEKVQNLFQMLLREHQKRRRMCASYGGGIADYRRGGGKPIPDIVVVVENYIAFSESFESAADDFYKLSREGSRYGIYFILTTSGVHDVRIRMAQNFKQVFLLQLNEESEYREMLGKTGNVRPAERRGSGICRMERVVEFQVAALAPHDCSNVYRYIRERAESIADAYRGVCARRIPTMPEHTYPEDLERRIETVGLDHVPVGVDAKSLDVLYWDFSKKGNNLVMYGANAGHGFMQGLAEMLSANSSRRVIVMDPSSVFAVDSGTAYELHRGEDACKQIFAAISAENLRRWNACRDAELAGVPLPEYTETVVLMPALSSLVKSISYEDKEVMFQVFAHVRPEMRLSYVYSMPGSDAYCIDGAWAKAVSRKDAIWIGGEISSQYFLYVSGTHLNDVPDDSYGYYIAGGKCNLMKALCSAARERGGGV